MLLKLIANVESFGNDHYIASIESIKGMVVEGNSVEEVCKELLISLKVKLAYDLGIDIHRMKDKVHDDKNMSIDIEDLKFENGRATKEINLNLVSA